MVKNDATFDATKGDLYAKLLESAEKHEVELSFEKRIVLQPPASECTCALHYCKCMAIALKCTICFTSW